MWPRERTKVITADLRSRLRTMVVLASSLILAVLGFVPGTLLAWVLYQVVEVNIFLPMPMPLVKMLSIFAMILVMCVMSGVLAMQKLRSVDPAEMF